MANGGVYPMDQMQQLPGECLPTALRFAVHCVLLSITLNSLLISSPSPIPFDSYSTRLF